MDNKKLAAAALVVLLAGVLLGRAGGGASADELNKARLKGCKAFAEKASSQQITCALKKGKLHVLVQGQDVYNLDDDKPIN